MSRKQDTLAVCGNPLYLEWLKVWMENAKDNNNTKLYYTYKKAFESMSVYPLPFNHPREAAILSGIGPIICKKLEKKLKEHCDEHDLTMPEPPDEISSSKQVVVTENINQDQEKRNSNFFEPKKRKKATSSKTYVPKYRTGPYAIMVALYKSYKDELTHSMTKSDLLREAQKYSDTSFEVSNNRRKHYTAWSSVKILLERDYVYKSGCPSRFSLTDIGMSVAQQMADIQIEQGHEAINTVDENQLNSNDEKNVNESDTIEIKESVASNTEGNQQGAIEIEDNLTAEPVLTLEPYCSNNINLPNYDFEDRDFIQDALINRGVKLSVRSLELGDVLWVAKKYGSTTKDEEIVLDYIIERKRMDDLIGSIKDGRFREQKFRLSKSGINNIIYLVEDYDLESALEFGIENIKSALSSTQILNGFFLKRTSSIDQTVEYLIRVTNMLKSVYEESITYIIPDNLIYRSTFLTLKEQLATVYKDRIYHVSYASYSELNSKSKSLTLRDIFLKFLMTIKGISAEKAMEIIKKYPTPHDLFEAFNSLNTEGEKKRMIKDIYDGMIRRKKFGPALSEKVYKIWHADNY
ncbi:1292_t:CDS:2 [Entrophospora sp. SA101]|nr:1292_t:CDS:2 [Entrophospora sp. SA101]